MPRQPHPGSKNPVASEATTLPHAETPPPATVSQVTQTPTATPRQTTATRPALPGYEILSELGRGGMGVVFKARQVQANRVVALKMILAGGLAGSDELARFKTEAEAVARLQHPAIVQVYDVGEHQGLPYFSMEFVEGGSLHHKLNGQPLPPKPAARLTALLAQAMQAAHDKGILHRDLKPANIFLMPTKDNGGIPIETGDRTPIGPATAKSAPRFLPKIGDFGLAKKIADAREGSATSKSVIEASGSSGLTATNAIMGTPSYMAPEQAQGKSRDITAAADIYSLGAILYELLTGRPPFRAASSLETLLQVVDDEPVRPRQVNAKTPRDLETICLKCLHKQPARRYESAEALAQDLKRFLKDEPIHARPVGRIERSWRWCRRNPLVAGISAALAAALVAGAAISATFGIRANRQADLARKNEADALTTAADLKIANDNLDRTVDNLDRTVVDLKRTTGELTRSRDDLEKTLARSLMGPLGIQAGPAEQDALWELATNRRGRLGYRVVEEATSSAANSRRLRKCTPALSVAVGLDLQTRDDVEALLCSRLDDAAISDEQKLDLAFVLSSWDDVSTPGAARALAYLMSCASQPETILSGNDWIDLQNALPVLVARLDAKEMAPVATSIVQGMKDTRDQSAIDRFSAGLSAVAGRLDAKDAKPLCRILVQRMKDCKDPPTLHTLARALQPLAAGLDADDAAALVAILMRKMKEEKNEGFRDLLNKALLILALRLDAKDAPPIARELLERMRGTTNTNGLSELAEGLFAVVARLDAKDKGAYAADAANILLQTIKNNGKNNPIAVGILTQRLATVPLAAKDASIYTAQTATFLLQSLGEIKDPFTFERLARELAFVAAGLEAQDAASAATLLVQAIKNAPDSQPVNGSEWCLRMVAARMETKDVETAISGLVQDIDKIRDPLRMQRAAQCLSQLADRLDEKDATAYLAEAGAPFVQAIQEGKPQGWRWLGQGLAAVATRQDAKEAAATADLLARTMKDAKFSVTGLDQALMEVVAHLDTKDAPRIATTLSQAITESAKEPNNQVASGNLPSLVHSLSAVADRLKPEDAAQVAMTLVQVMKDRSKQNENVLNYLNRIALPTVANRLEAKDAALTAKVLIQALRETKDIFALQQLVQALSIMTGRLGPKDAASCIGEAAPIVVRTMKTAKKAMEFQPLADTALPVLAGGLGSEDTEWAASILMPRLNKPVTEFDVLDLSVIQALFGHVPYTPFSRRLPAMAAVGAFPTSTGAALVSVRMTLLGAPAPPCRLSTQQLIEVMKMPVCMRSGRRVILDELANRYHRDFSDVWEFIRFATEQNLGLDFTTPAHSVDQKWWRLT